jgi:hypothetical protein
LLLRLWWLWLARRLSLHGLPRLLRPRLWLPLGHTVHRLLMHAKLLVLHMHLLVLLVLLLHDLHLLLDLRSLQLLLVRGIDVASHDSRLASMRSCRGELDRAHHRAVAPKHSKRADRRALRGEGGVQRVGALAEEGVAVELLHGEKRWDVGHVSHPLVVQRREVLRLAHGDLGIGRHSEHKAEVLLRLLTVVGDPPESKVRVQRVGRHDARHEHRRVASFGQETSQLAGRVLNV